MKGLVSGTSKVRVSKPETGTLVDRFGDQSNSGGSVDEDLSGEFQYPGNVEDEDEESDDDDSASKAAARNAQANRDISQQQTIRITDSKGAIQLSKPKGTVVLGGPVDGSDDWKAKYEKCKKDLDAANATISQLKTTIGDKDSEIAQLKTALSRAKKPDRGGDSARSAELAEALGQVSELKMEIANLNMQLFNARKEEEDPLSLVSGMPRPGATEAELAFEDRREIKRLKTQIQERDQAIYELRDQLELAQNENIQFRNKLDVIEAAALQDEEKANKPRKTWYGTTKKPKKTGLATQVALGKEDGSNVGTSHSMIAKSGIEGYESGKGGSEPGDFYGGRERGGRNHEQHERDIKRIVELERNIGRVEGENEMLDQERCTLEDKNRKLEAHIELLKAQQKMMHEDQLLRGMNVALPEHGKGGDQWHLVSQIQESALRKVAAEKEELERTLISIEHRHGATLNNTDYLEKERQIKEESMRMSMALSISTSKILDLERILKEKSLSEEFLKNEVEKYKGCVSDLESLYSQQMVGHAEQRMAFVAMLATATADGTKLQTEVHQSKMQILTSSKMLDGEMKALREGRVRKMTGEPPSYSVFPSGSPLGFPAKRFHPKEMQLYEEDEDEDEDVISRKSKGKKKSRSRSTARTEEEEEEEEESQPEPSPSITSESSTSTASSEIRQRATMSTFPHGMESNTRYVYRWTGGGYVLEGAKDIPIMEPQNIQPVIRQTAPPPPQGAPAEGIVRPAVTVYSNPSPGPFPNPARDLEKEYEGPRMVTQQDQIFAQTALKTWVACPPRSPEIQQVQSGRGGMYETKNVKRSKNKEETKHGETHNKSRRRAASYSEPSSSTTNEYENTRGRAPYGSNSSSTGSNPSDEFSRQMLEYHRRYRLRKQAMETREYMKNNRPMHETNKLDALPELSELSSGSLEKLKQREREAAMRRIEESATVQLINERPAGYSEPQIIAVSSTAYRTEDDWAAQRASTKPITPTSRPATIMVSPGGVDSSLGTCSSRIYSEKRGAASRPVYNERLSKSEPPKWRPGGKNFIPAGRTSYQTTKPAKTKYATVHDHSRQYRRIGSAAPAAASDYENRQPGTSHIAATPTKIPITLADPEAMSSRFETNSRDIVMVERVAGEDWRAASQSIGLADTWTAPAFNNNINTIGKSSYTVLDTKPSGISSSSTFKPDAALFESKQAENANATIWSAAAEMGILTSSSSHSGTEDRSKSATRQADKSSPRQESVTITTPSSRESGASPVRTTIKLSSELGDDEKKNMFGTTGVFSIEDADNDDFTLGISAQSKKTAPPKSYQTVSGSFDFGAKQPAAFAGSDCSSTGHQKLKFEHSDGSD